MLVLLVAVATGAVAQETYKVSVKEGTEDAANWTITPAEATTTGVAAGTEESHLQRHEEGEERQGGEEGCSGRNRRDTCEL